jgi:hypothetical protein
MRCFVIICSGIAVQTSPLIQPETKPMDAWDARRVFFVEEVEQPLAFYTDRLGFSETNRYAASPITFFDTVMVR